jgi:CheY-like chemotaxis protein
MLPHASLVSHATMDGLEAERAGRAPKVEPLQVLLVDDEPALLRSLGGLLVARGHRVSTASDGTQAVERCTSERPDVVLMDLDMPRMGGRDALEALRRRDPTLKVLLMSGEWDEAYARDLGLEPGGTTGFVLKPCGMATLEAAISDLMEGRPPLAPRAAAR